MSARNLKRRLLGYSRGDDGMAAVEFAIWLAVLVPALANVMDVTLYAYDKTQVANAAQALAQAVWSVSANGSCTFSASNTPAQSCSAITSALKSNAIAGSSALGAAGNITEYTTTGNANSEAWGFYCVNSTTGQLSSNASATCPTGGASLSGAAGYYYKVTVTFTYHPLFGSASVTGLLGTTMYQSAWVRLQ